MPTPFPPSLPVPEPATRGVRCHALVPCAGVGARAGADGPKQYARVGGRPMVAWTLQALQAVPELAGTWVVIAPGDRQFEALQAAGEIPRGDTLHLVRDGGETRAHSVLAGLAALRAAGAPDDDWVLVHDAARCLLRPEWVGRLVRECRDDAVGGLLALPVPDTLKRAALGAGAASAASTERAERAERAGGAEGAEGAAAAEITRTAGTDEAAAAPRVAATVPRESMWAAQTPQMFRLGPLAEAIARGLAGAAPNLTDESSAIEALGLRPRLVRGDHENLKITWPGDFELAERLLRTRAEPA